MSIPNRLGWSFVASPRELQFFVIGVAVGMLAILIGRATSAPTELILYGFAAVLAAFVILGIVRGEGR